MTLSPFTLVYDNGPEPPQSAKMVGIWDLGAWVGRLPGIIEALNKAQSDIVMFEIHAAIPSGLTSKKERVEKWAAETLRRKLGKAEREEITDAVIDAEFAAVGEPIRKHFRVQYLIGITPDAIAGEMEAEEDGVYSDLFFSGDGRVTLVSTTGLRQLARKAERPFEFAVAFVLLGALLSIFNPKADMHDETRGCLFDLNFDRKTIVKGLRKPWIDDECMKAIKPSNRATTRALLDALSSYKGA